MSSLRLRRFSFFPRDLLLLAVTGLHLAYLVFLWGGEPYRLLLGNLLYLLPTLVATAVVFRAAFGHRGKARRGWLLIGGAVAADAVGTSIWAYLELIPKVSSFPSSGDLFYLMSPPLLTAGLLHLMPAPRNRLEGTRLGLDLAITVGAAGLFFWRYLFVPVLGAGGDTLSMLVGLAYPGSDLVFFSLLLLLVMRRDERSAFRPELFFLGLGLTLKLAGDIAFNVFMATYSTAHPIDGVWTGATALLALAASSSVSPHGARGVPAKPRAFNGYLIVALPYLAVAAALGLLLASETGLAVHHTLSRRGVLYGSLFVVFLVVLRQLFAFNENWRLTRHLAEHSAELESLSAGLERRVQARTAELEALSRRFRHDALHDALTGLPNRAHFREQLGGVVASGEPFAVLYLDFDRFKSVNDSFGHAVGDALLVALGGRLQASARPGDLAARLGGDEFAVLLAGVADTAAAARLAERLMALFAEPFAVPGHLLHTTPSVGVVWSGVWGGVSAEETMRDADIAMYRAKAQGRACFVVFEATMREHLLTRLALEADLRGAAARGELEVYYQPVLEAANGSLAGFEALVRWQHPERGLVSPADFIPLAEETGLVVELDRWVLECACAQLRVWQETAPELSVSVNLSSRNFARPDLEPFVAETLAHTGLRPEHLTLELTEGTLLERSRAVQDNLTALGQLGVRLHIDDFGTGYSSLAYLQRFDADALKIDRAFVAGLLKGGDHAELVKTVIGMAHNLGMQVVAEGVESEGQLAELCLLGCEYVQGYLFSRPVPAAEAERLLRHHAAVVA